MFAIHSLIFDWWGIGTILPSGNTDWITYTMMAQALIVYTVIAILSIAPLWNFYAIKARAVALQKLDDNKKDK